MHETVSQDFLLYIVNLLDILNNANVKDIFSIYHNFQDHVELRVVKQVTPAAGMIRPDHVVDVCVHHEETHKLEDLVEGVPQNCWADDTNDKQVILLVIVRGICSTEHKTHRVNIRHCFSGNSLRLEQKINARRSEGTHKSF